MTLGWIIFFYRKSYAMDTLHFTVFWATSPQRHHIMRRSLSRSSKMGYFAHRPRLRIIVRTKRMFLGSIQPACNCCVDHKACSFCCIAKRPSTVNGESILPTMAVNEDLQTLTHKAEDKSRQLRRMLAHFPSPAEVTPEVKNTRPPCQRRAACRKVKVRKSSERV